MCSSHSLLANQTTIFSEDVAQAPAFGTGSAAISRRHYGGTLGQNVNIRGHTQHFATVVTSGQTLAVASPKGH